MTAVVFDGVYLKEANILVLSSYITNYWKKPRTPLRIVGIGIRTTRTSTTTIRTTTTQFEVSANLQ